jgi:hypothetical protein
VTGTKTLQKQRRESPVKPLSVSETLSVVQVVVRALVSNSKIITKISNQVDRTSSFLQVLLGSLGGTINHCLKNIRIQVRSKFASLHHQIGDYIGDFQSLLQITITTKQSGGMEFPQSVRHRMRALADLPRESDEDDGVRHDFPDVRQVKDMLGILPQVPQDDQRNEDGSSEHSKKRLKIEEPPWNPDLIFQKEINVLSEGFNMLVVYHFPTLNLIEKMFF